MTLSQGCHDHSQPGHVCNHAPSSVSESLDEMEFSRSIHAACINNNLTRVQTILAKGSTGLASSPATSQDSAGYTALHYASRSGNKEICTLLLNAGAYVDAKTPELGATPLMRAIQQNHLATARLLVSYGASIDTVNADQENIFHIVAMSAVAATSKNYNTTGTSDQDAFVDMTRWLRTKARSQFGDDGLERMLQARNKRGHTPMECLQDQYGLSALAAVLSL
ncbi:Ankyrin repeat domain-containing protein 39 [Mortierella claussenii]|nr:Ankyrin repeat domain-containing protein 39 [Mortierella claussenii]